MKRRKQDWSSLSLFEPTVRWSALPLDVQQELVDTLARLLVQTRPSTNAHATPVAAPRPDTSSPQENDHDAP